MFASLLRLQRNYLRTEKHEIVNKNFESDECVGKDISVPQAQCVICETLSTVEKINAGVFSSDNKSLTTTVKSS